MSGIDGAFNHPDSRIGKLETDIDDRIEALIVELLRTKGEFSFAMVVPFMRAAYGKGYCDGLLDEPRGKLCSDHGYKVPTRRQREPA